VVGLTLCLHTANIQKLAQIKQIFCKFFTKCLEMSKIIPTFAGERIALVVLGIPMKET
jgi:hypothetical protein